MARGFCPPNIAHPNDSATPKRCQITCQS